MLIWTSHYKISSLQSLPIFGFHLFTAVSIYGLLCPKPHCYLFCSWLSSTGWFCCRYCNNYWFGCFSEDTMRLLVLFSLFFLPRKWSFSLFLLKKTDSCNWKLPEGWKLEGKHSEYTGCFYRPVSFQASFAVSKSNLEVSSTWCGQYCTNNIHFKRVCIRKPLIVGPVKTLILLLQIISCNIIQTGLMAQFELCHATHQFYFHLAFFFF